MRFEIRGARLSDGRDIIRFYTAASEEAARQKAHDEGIAVESAEFVVDLLASNTQTDGAEPAEQVPLSYNSEAVRGTLPSYHGLRIAGAVLRIYAYLCYSAAMILLAMTIFELIASLSGGSALWVPNQTASTPRGGTSPLIQSTSGLEVAALFALVAPMFVVLLIGAVAHGLGSACSALRDIARNSWHRDSAG